MQARTKKQKAIIEVSNTLADITPAQVEYAYKHCFKQVGYRSKTKGTGCLECGHVWQLAPEVKSCDCPACGVHITIEDTRKRKLDTGKKYMSILEVRGDYQVVRIFELRSYQEVGKKGDKFIWEVVRQFFTPDSEMQVVARCRTTSFNIDSFGGQLECRAITGWYGNKYDLWTDVTHPAITVLPIYARNGYSALVCELSHYKVMRKILRDSKSETLLKAGQIGLLGCRITDDHYNKIDRYWDSIKICIRNSFNVSSDDVLTYLDYLDLLLYYRKDLNSPHYVCKPDFKVLHDRLVAKKQIEKKRMAEAKERRQMLQDQEAFEAAKKSFFGLMFSNGKITVKVLESVQEFIEEGLKLHHCLHTNNYHRKANSLILSARIDNNPIETIELLLDEMKIVQSRGLQNQATEHHDEILKLVKKNIPKIRKVYKQIAA